MTFESEIEARSAVVCASTRKRKGGAELMQLHIAECGIAEGSDEQAEGNYLEHLSWQEQESSPERLHAESPASCILPDCPLRHFGGCDSSCIACGTRRRTSGCVNDLLAVHTRLALRVGSAGGLVLKVDEKTYAIREC